MRDTFIPSSRSERLAWEQEAIGVFLEVHRIDDLLFADLPGHRQLGQDGVETIIGVETGDEPEDVFVGRSFRQSERLREDADFGAIGGLSRYVADGSGVVADDDGGETRRDAARLEGGNPRCDIRFDFRGHGIAIDELGGHTASVPARRDSGYALARSVGY